MYNCSRQENVEVVFFEQVDELWKDAEGLMGCRQHWGHFYANGILKEAYRPVYNSISPKPVTDAASVRWAENEILELVSKGVSPGRPVAVQPELPIKRGEFMHYLSIRCFRLKSARPRPLSPYFTNMYYYSPSDWGRKRV